jgi:hypothetical protein
LQRLDLDFAGEFLVEGRYGLISDEWRSPDRLFDEQGAGDREQGEGNPRAARNPSV